MTQLFDENGVVHPVTVLEAGPVVVTQKKTSDRDGYAAVQLGFGEKQRRKIAKAQQGHFGDLGMFRYVQEYRPKDARVIETVSRGDTVDVSAFEEGDVVRVSALSKGKGFQGVVKRHDFAGGPRTHGQRHSEREPGSIGAIGPQRVMKGKKMAGRMGNRRNTIRNLDVVAVDPEEHRLYIRGAVPGPRGALVEIEANQQPVPQNA